MIESTFHVETRYIDLIKYSGNSNAVFSGENLLKSSFQYITKLQIRYNDSIDQYDKLI